MWTELLAGAAAGFASIPHCTAMCGPLAAYACSSQRTADAPARYHSGRLLAYAAVGLAAGGLGSVVVSSAPGPWGSALLSWSLAIGLGLAALRLWRKPRERLVAIRTKDDHEQSHKRSAFQRLRGLLLARPFLLGAATALLPCGALAAAVLIAASSGTAPGGTVTMVAFAVASAAGLVGAGWLSARLRARPARPATSRILATVFALGAVVFVVRPLSGLNEGAPACHDAAGEHASHAAHLGHEGHP